MMEQTNDPELAVAPRLPQPFRTIVKTLESIFEDAWREIETRKMRKPSLRPEWTRTVKQKIISVIPRGITACLVATDTTLYLFDGEDTKELDFDGSISFVSNVAGNRVAASRTNGTTLLVSLVEWKILKTFDIETEDGLRLSPSLLCVYGRDSTIVLDATSGEDESRCEIEGAARVDFVPTMQKTLLCHWKDQTICRKLAVRPQQNEPVQLAEWLMPSLVTCAAIDGNRVAAIGLQSGLTVLWDLSLDSFRHILPRRHRNNTSVVSVVFQGNHSLATLGSDSSLHIFALKGAHSPPELVMSHLPAPTHPCEVKEERDDVKEIFAIGGGCLLRIARSSAVVVYDLDTGFVLGDLTQTDQEKKRRISAAGGSDDEEAFAVASENGTISFYSSAHITDGLQCSAKSRKSKCRVDDVEETVFDTQILVSIAVREARENRERREADYSRAMKSFSAKLLTLS